MQGEYQKPLIHHSITRTWATEDEIHEKDLFQVIIHNKYSQGIFSVST